MLPKNYTKPTKYKKGGARKKKKRSGKPVPTNPSLWSRAKSMAKQKFDVYPSAYANAYAAKEYKKMGGGWRGGKKALGGPIDLPGSPTEEPPLKMMKTIQPTEPEFLYREKQLGDPVGPVNMLGYAQIYPGGPSKERLKQTSLDLKNKFLNKGEVVIEDDRIDYIKDVMGPYSDGSWLDPTKDAWSAVTTSYLIGNYIGEDNPEAIANRGFRPNVAHSYYIADAFKTNTDPDYKYNAYNAQKIPKSLDEVQEGDLFFRNWTGKSNSYKGFERRATKLADKDFDKNYSFNSHTDIVVDKGTDAVGDFVILAGGNVGDTVLREKFYLKDLNKKYAGHMVQNSDRNFSEAVKSEPSTSDYFDLDTSDFAPPKMNAGGYMGQMDPSDQMLNQAIMDNQMLAAGVNPNDPYYSRLYKQGGYMNVLAGGGELYSTGGQQDKLTRIDAGGTHEQNPLEGVPMGPDALVEQGETVQRGVEPGTDFVFSERLPQGGITPEMAQDAGLPKFTVGKSFAKASKMIEDKSSRSGDILDRNTREVTLARLRDTQEELKDREFQNQLAEIEDMYGRSAQPNAPEPGQGMQMPGMVPRSQEDAMLQQMAADQGMPPQPSPQEMAMMQAGMQGQQPPMQMPHGGEHQKIGSIDRATAQKQMNAYLRSIGQSLNPSFGYQLAQNSNTGEFYYIDQQGQRVTGNAMGAQNQPVQTQAPQEPPGLQQPGVTFDSAANALVDSRFPAVTPPTVTPPDLTQEQLQALALGMGMDPSPSYLQGLDLGEIPQGVIPEDYINQDGQADNLIYDALVNLPNNPNSADYMDFGRAAYGDHNMQQAEDLALWAQRGSLPGTPFADPNTAMSPTTIPGGMSLSPEEMAYMNNMYTQGLVDPVRDFTTMPSNVGAADPNVSNAPYADSTTGPRAEEIPLTPEEIAFQNNLYQQPGFDPVRAFTGVTPTGDIDPPSPPLNRGFLRRPDGTGIDPLTGEYRGHPQSTDPNAVNYNPDSITSEIAMPLNNTEGLLEFLKSAESKDFEKKEKVDLSLDNFNNPYKGQILADSGMKFLQGIKDIRERNAADYMLHSDYDPYFFPIEEQRKAISNMSASTRKQLSRRVSNPGLYLALAGNINASEAAETAKLFEKKFQVEAADNARIRELVRADKAANAQMKQLIDELNEKDRQGKEQLLLESANSFSEAYSGFSKEEFYKFMAEQYMKNADMFADTPSSAGSKGEEDGK